MKAKFVILLLLLVSCSTKTNFSEMFECLLSSEKIKNEAAKVLDVFKSKNYDSLFKVLVQAYFNVKDDVLNCINEPILKFDPCQACMNACDANDKPCRIACVYTDCS